MQPAVNVLPSSANISDPTNERRFLTQFVLDKWKSRVKVQLHKLQRCLRPVNTLIPERCSERGAFPHSTNHIFRSQ